MSTHTLRVSRLIRETAGFLFPLGRAGEDSEITRIEFALDLQGAAPASGGGDACCTANLAGVVVLVTESVNSVRELDKAVTKYSGATALIMPPDTHTHVGAGNGRSDESESVGTSGHGPLLLEKTAAVTWSEVLVQLRQLAQGASDAVGWPDVDDLSSLAAVIADMTGASITIEDPASRVLAHANLGEDIDEIRTQTILTGAIPDWRIAELEASGFLPAIRASQDVVERPASAGEPARSVIALRSEGELLGTIWAAYADEVEPEKVRSVLREAARAALPVMLRTLRRSPFEKRLRSEALGSILGGSRDIGPAATLLSLPFAGNYTALALAEVDSETEALLRFHLRAAFADAVLSRGADTDRATGGHLAVLLQSAEPEDAEDIRERIVSTLERTMPPDVRLVLGIGTGVERLDHVHDSWTEAVYVLEAQLSLLAAVESGQVVDDDGFGLGSGRVSAAIAADLPAEIVGLEVADALVDADPRIPAPATILAAHDARNQGQLLRTLRVYFEAVGNSAEASRRLHVHSNSLRHRLGKIEELTGLSPFRKADRLWLELSVLVSDRSGIRREG